MNKTPRAGRIHIGVFGRRNSGKSSLVNALTGQHTAIVSDVAGTTTDPVYKSMELHGVGPVVFIDTAGFDDTAGELGSQRVEQTRKAARRTDVAIVVMDGRDTTEESQWIEWFRSKKIPVIPVINKADTLPEAEALSLEIESRIGARPVVVSALTGQGIRELTKAVVAISSETDAPDSITGELARKGDTVMLVMPQDPQAPKGRLILPQAQTIRDLLDKECTVVSCTAAGMEVALKALAAAPKLIITDSQVFATVEKLTPANSLLTSFSVLFARFKGDIDSFAEGARAIASLTEKSRVLIAEACTHAPLTEDIGREKIPAMLRKRVGQSLRVDVVAGADFPSDLTPYDLVIHCGACMFNRRHVLSRIDQAQTQGVPITNYGIAIAYLTGILDKVVWPR